MKIYLVGGAVRNRLLGLPVTERDWVVVGAKPAELLALGYQQVGKEFPVFLHPQTREEYALARTERKTGHGYQGFSFDYSASVTLTADLERRDLTINAIAESVTGELIDPWGGQRDIAERQLRHVSAAFAEDPVRLLRVARFYAQFAALNFQIAAETQALLQQMVVAGEVDYLVPERIWQEWHKALKTARPELFTAVLQQVGALARILPVLQNQDIQFGQQALIEAVKLSQQADIRFAAWLGSFPLTIVQAVLDILRPPKTYAQLARLVSQQAEFFANAAQLDPESLLLGLQQLDALRRPQRFQEYLLAATAVWQATTSDQAANPAEFLQQVWQQVNSITIQDIDITGLSGTEIATALTNKRLELISK